LSIYSLIYVHLKIGDITRGEAFGKAICSPSEDTNTFYSLEDTHLLVLDSDIGVKVIQ